MNKTSQGREVGDVNYLYELLKGSNSDFLVYDVDYTKLKYVIYARKSTIGDERQEHSIADQVALCMKICVEQEGLNVVEVIEEKGSAKEPDIRPGFKELVRRLKTGEIDGIIAYHPDRLSRNMKEAGELIDLLDKKVLQDLRFATSHFENSPTGKMLLGISFVLSKQYSENLSQVVTRGNVKATEERGEYLGKLVHGYRILKDRSLEPDGVNYQIIQRMFQMRLDGETLSDIAKWANTQNYHVEYRGRRPVQYAWNKNRVSKLMKRPVYAGVLKYGVSLVVLRDHYDFIPVLSVDEFLKINEVTDLASPTISSSIVGVSRKAVRANLLRGMVYCGTCHKKMSSGITSKKSGERKTEYYYFRCENNACSVFNKSVRAKVVVGTAIEFFKDNLFTTEVNYRHYIDDAKESLSEKRRAANSNIGKLSQELNKKNREFERLKEVILLDPQLTKHFDIDELVKEREELVQELAGARRGLEGLKDSLVTYEKYLELFSNIGYLLEENISKSIKMSALDAILRKFFSNFTLTASGEGRLTWEVTAIELKEPWKGFMLNQNVFHGRAEDTLLELFNFIMKDPRTLAKSCQDLEVSYLAHLDTAPVELVI